MQFQIEHFDEVSSTNTLAKERAEQGAPEGLVIVAKHQTAGRGKLDRKWLSSPYKNLLFTLLIRPPVDPSQAPILTQISCRSVAMALGFHYGIESHFKFPNDLLVDGKKICGILTESAAKGKNNLDYAIIGVGLNVNEAPQEFADQAVCMKELLNRELETNLLLKQILDQLASDLKGLYARPF